MFRTLTVILAITLMALAYGGAKAEEAVDSEARATATQAQADAAQAEQGVSDVSGGLVALQQLVADLEAAVTAGLADLQTAFQAQIDALSLLIPSAVSEISVDCTVGTITDAVALATPGTPLTVTFEGTCVEDVSIVVDDITLAGLDPDNHTLSIIQGQVTVDGAQRVVIENGTFTGPRRGVLVTKGGEATIRKSTITGNSSVDDISFDGVRVDRGSSALLQNLMITGNSRDGVFVQRSSTATLQFVTITGNTRRGFTSTRGSSGRIENTTIMANGSRGLYVNRGSMLHVLDSTIKLNVGRDVFLSKGSHGAIEDSVIGPNDPDPLDPVPNTIRVEFSNLQLRNVAVTGDVTLISHATLEGSSRRSTEEDPHEDPTKITGNVQLSRGSLLTHGSSSSRPFTVTGNVTCSTSQSGLGVTSNDFDAGGFSDGLGLDILGTVDLNCTLMNRLIGPQS